MARQTATMPNMFTYGPNPPQWQSQPSGMGTVPQGTGMPPNMSGYGSMGISQNAMRNAPPSAISAGPGPQGQPTDPGSFGPQTRKTTGTDEYGLGYSGGGAGYDYNLPGGGTDTGGGGGFDWGSVFNQQTMPLWMGLLTGGTAAIGAAQGQGSPDIQYPPPSPFDQMRMTEAQRFIGDLRGTAPSYEEWLQWRAPQTSEGNEAAHLQWLRDNPGPAQQQFDAFLERGPEAWQEAGLGTPPSIWDVPEMALPDKQALPPSQQIFQGQTPGLDPTGQLGAPQNIGAASGLNLGGTASSMMPTRETIKSLDPRVMAGIQQPFQEQQELMLNRLSQMGRMGPVGSVSPAAGAAMGQFGAKSAGQIGRNIAQITQPALMQAARFRAQEQMMPWQEDVARERAQWGEQMGRERAQWGRDASREEAEWQANVGRETAYTAAQNRQGFAEWQAANAANTQQWGAEAGGMNQMWQAQLAQNQYPYQGILSAIGMMPPGQQPIVTPQGPNPWTAASQTGASMLPYMLWGNQNAA